MATPGQVDVWDGTDWVTSTVEQWDGTQWNEVLVQQMGGSAPDDFVPGWGTPTWRDEFEGTAGAPPDPASWTALGPSFINTDADGYILPDHAFLDGSSHLVLRTEKMAAPISGRTYGTGYITSAGKVAFRYGRWEVRYLSLKPLSTRGIWFGPWVRDSSGGGEADISESVGTPCAHPGSYPSDGSTSSSTFYTQTGTGTIGTTRTANTLWKYPAVDPSAQVDGMFYGYHVGALEYTPQRMTIYNDGVKVLEVTTDDALGQSVINTGFPTTQHMRLSQHCGSDWAGHPDDADTQSPYDTLVDYVRYWPYTGQA